jgi:hypothetical protein
MFAQTLLDLQFISSLVDPNVWLREAVKKYGEQYYEYLFVYDDDILVISESPEAIITTLSQSYHLKDGSVSWPKNNLGVEIKEFQDPKCPAMSMWSMSAEKYLKEAIKNVEHDLEGLNYKLPTWVKTPLSHNYQPELDVSAFLDDDYTRWYQQLIGILCWSIELGRINIHLCIALLAQYLAQQH